MSSTVLACGDWSERARAHAERVDVWIQPHLARRLRGEAHPVHDFLFTYYSQRPAALRRWHPGYGVTLEDAPEYGGMKGYGPPPLVEEVAPTPPLVEEVAPAPPLVEEVAPTPPLVEEVAQRPSRNLVTVTPDYLRSQLPLVARLHTLLTATASRPPTLGCFGLHEWAMVYRSTGTPGEANAMRHDWPLRLGHAATDEVVEGHRITCSHFDAFRFFTDPARPLNTLQPGRDDRPAFEQPGCLHAGMDLYKHAFRLSPLIPSELVADAFELAWDIRTLDMRAAPYDFTGVRLDPTGEPWTPVPIETAEGKAEYVRQQREFAERGAPIRQRLIEECDRLLASCPESSDPKGDPQH